MVTRYTLNWSELDVVRTADSLGWGGGKGKDEYVFGAQKIMLKLTVWGKNGYLRVLFPYLHES